MIALDKLKKEINALDESEFSALLDYMQTLRREAKLKAFDNAVSALQAGITRQEIDQIQQALGEEHVEAVNVEQWRE